MKISKWIVTAMVIAVCVSIVKVIKDNTLKAHFTSNAIEPGARIKGALDAQLRIQEFTDFQCPSCAKVVPIVDELLQKYNGKISVQHKYYPLPGHKNSMKAAIYAECTAAQGKFWPYQDSLFAKQSSWSGLEDPSQYFDDLAMQVNVNMEKLKDCLAGKDAANRVGEDKLDGELLRVMATPTFVINGKLIVGGDNLKTELESRLGK